VNQDTQAAGQQLRNKEVDIITTLADATVAELLRDDPAVTIFSAPGQTYEHLDFRMDHPLLRDKAVRQAFAACVDRQDLVDKLIKDIDPHAAPLGNLLFTPTEHGYQDHYADTGDVNTAEQILTDAGYTRGADGIFAKNGQRLSIRLGHRSTERRNQTTRLIQSHCASAGISIQDDASDNFNDVRIDAGEFDMALFAWVGTRSSPAPTATTPAPTPAATPTTTSTPTANSTLSWPEPTPNSTSPSESQFSTKPTSRCGRPALLTSVRPPQLRRQQEGRHPNLLHRSRRWHHLEHVLLATQLRPKAWGPAVKPNWPSAQNKIAESGLGRHRPRSTAAPHIGTTMRQPPDSPGPPGAVGRTACGR